LPVLSVNRDFVIVKCVTQSFMSIDRHLSFNWSCRATWSALYGLHMSLNKLFRLTLPLMTSKTGAKHKSTGSVRFWSIIHVRPEPKTALVWPPSMLFSGERRESGQGVSPFVHAVQVYANTISMTANRLNS